MVSVWNALTGKEYEDDPSFNFGEALLQVPMQLSEPEQEFMRSTSAQEFENKLSCKAPAGRIARDSRCAPAGSHHQHPRSWLSLLGVWVRACVPQVQGRLRVPAAAAAQPVGSEQ